MECRCLLYRASLRYAIWRKKTPGTISLRKLMHKCNMTEASTAASHWETFYGGYDERLNQKERIRRNYIENGALAKHTAWRMVNEMDASTPFLNRLGSIEALAALAAIFAEDMDRKVQGANQRIAHILWCAADPDRLEWLFNDIRWRHMLSSELSWGFEFTVTRLSQYRDPC